MKKLISSMLLCITVALSVSSCSNDEENLNNPLNSTLWSFEDEVTVINKHEFTRYIEFIDDSTVKIWDTDNGNIYTGTYTVNGNKVTFSNLYDAYWMRYYIDGTFTSKSLTVSFSYDKEQTTNLSYDTYTKE